jgi:para-aminobenzoate synthetase component I
MPLTRLPLQLRRLSQPICFLGGNGDGWQTTLAWQPTDRFICQKGDRHDPSTGLTGFVKRQQALGRKIIGYVAYDFGYALHDISQTTGLGLELPYIYFLAFDNYAHFTEAATEAHYTDDRFLAELEALTSNPPESHSQELVGIQFQPALTRDSYNQAFRAIKRYIIEGDVYQINLTQALIAQTDAPARKLFAHIAAANPVSYQAYLEGPGFEVLSASPECFIRSDGQTITTHPIKGTRPRSSDPIQDRRYREELISSPKEMAELNMITDLLRNDLGQVCEFGSVKLTDHRVITAQPSVWHAHSEIEGRLTKDVAPIEALLSMFPGGSITGCPKKRAMEIIDELEPTARGLYTGSIVAINPDGSLDSSIVIRTIIKQGRKLSLQVGGGIVADSEEDSEYQETLDKARSLLEALQQL